jgi:hypothetical protein
MPTGSETSAAALPLYDAFMHPARDAEGDDAPGAEEQRGYERDVVGDVPGAEERGGYERDERDGVDVRGEGPPPPLGS